MQGRKLWAMLLLGAVFAGSVQCLGCASGQDIAPPQITDATAETPVTGSNFTVQAMVSDDIGVSYVRLYNLYFRIFNPSTNNITVPRTIPMNASGSVYYATFEVPDNAITLYYTISGNDTSNNWSITDVISRSVEDDKAPYANCTATVSLNLGGTWKFNGTASSDNVRVNNCTWHLQNGAVSIYLYGSEPSYTFNRSGDYAGRLTVKDIWGNMDTADFTVSVLDTEAPVADAGIGVYVKAGFMAFLDGSASSDNEGVVNYTWTYTANGTLVHAYGISPSVVFWTSGTYEVTLTVADRAGNTATATVTAEVLPGDGEAGGGISWWVYALAAMVLVFVILAALIVRM